MVEDAVRDGSRIGELLSSEVHGHEQGVMGRLFIVDADRDATPTDAGTFAYGVEYEAPARGDGTVDESVDGTTDSERAGGPVGRERLRLAEVYLHPDRVRVEFTVAQQTAIDAAEAAGLRAGPTDATTRGGDEQHVVSLSVESGAAVKRALRVVRDVSEALDEEVGET